MSDEAPVRLVKKYPNRRLYDTVESRYLSMQALAAIVRRGVVVRVLDAATGEDLTRATLTAMLLEERGAARYLAPAVLTRLIGMSDEALADFLGGYLEGALELYAQARAGAHSEAAHPPAAPVPTAPAANELGEIRRELDALKRLVARSLRPAARRTRR